MKALFGKKENHHDRYLLTLAFVSIFLFTSGILAHAVFADTVVATIPVGQIPMHDTTNPNTNKIYVSNQQSNTVSVINGSTNNVIKTIPVNNPTDIKANPVTNMIYVGSFESHSVSVIDGSTDTIVNTVSNIGPVWGLGINPDTNLIYAADYGNGNGIYVINGTTNTVAQKIPFAGNEIAHQPAINPNTDMIYVPVTCSFCHQSYIAVIDGHNNTRVMNIATGMRPTDADANPVTNMIYISDDASNYQLDVINGATNKLVTTIPITSCAAGVGVNPNTNLVYVANCIDNFTYIINGTNNSIVGKVAVGASPLGVAVNPNTNRIYVTNTQDNTTSVIDASISSPDFVISSPSSPAYMTIPVGSSENSTITASSFDGFSGTISLSASAPPSWTATLNPSSVTIQPGSSVTSLLTISVPPSSSTGPYEVTVSGTNGSLTHSATVEVLVSPTSPSAPQNLSATAVSSSQVNLSWNAPANNGDATITGYKIERSTDNGSTWSTVVSNTESTLATYSDAGLVHSITYTYRVSAINSVGTSSPSNIASATTPLLSSGGINVGPITTPTL